MLLRPWFPHPVHTHTHLIRQSLSLLPISRQHTHTHTFFSLSLSLFPFTRKGYTFKIKKDKKRIEKSCLPVVFLSGIETWRPVVGAAPRNITQGLFFGFEYLLERRESERTFFERLLSIDCVRVYFRWSPNRQWTLILMANYHPPIDPGICLLHARTLASGFFPPCNPPRRQTMGKN